MCHYKIIKKAENPLETIIRKTDFSVDFTLGDLENNNTYHEKLKKEIEAKKQIEEAKIVNVLRTNPEVEKMDEKTLIAAFLYYGAKSFCKTAMDKLKQIENQISKDTNEIKEIRKQTGLTKVANSKMKS